MHLSLMLFSKPKPNKKENEQIDFWNLVLSITGCVILDILFKISIYLISIIGILSINAFKRLLEVGNYLIYVKMLGTVSGTW